MRTQEQTRAIHQRQRIRRTLDGRLASVAKAALLALHRNAQRLLEPITIVNPYAPQLTFVDARTRTRRDHEKYLTLIDTVTLLHQHQRERQAITRDGRSLVYIEVSREDIAVANPLAAAVLGRSLDELPPQTRRFLDQLDAWIASECATQHCHRGDIRFLAREAREATGLGPTQAKVHLRRLADLENVLVHRAPRGQGVSYELAYERDPTADAALFSGLRDAGALGDTRCDARESQGYDAQRPDLSVARPVTDGERPGLGRPSAGGRPGEGRSDATAPISRADTDLSAASARTIKNAVNGDRRGQRRTIHPGAAS